MNILNSNRLLFSLSLSFNVHRRRHHRRSIICLEFSCPPFSFIFPFFFNGERKRERERERVPGERQQKSSERNSSLQPTTTTTITTNSREKQRQFLRTLHILGNQRMEKNRCTSFCLENRGPQGEKRKREEQRQLISFCVRM